MPIQQRPAKIEQVSMTHARILILIATYNERANLRSLIHEIHGYTPLADVLVVDDCSPDGTGEVADQLACEDSRIHVIHRAGKLGLGTALLEGMRFAVENRYDFCVTMDADFSHAPEIIPALIEMMQDVDIAIGSRYVAGGGSEGWPLHRRFISKSVNLLVGVLTGVPAKDASSGFRCYRVSRLQPLLQAKLLSKGYSFQQESLMLCCRSGCRIGEIPILFRDRSGGSSKAGFAEMWRSALILLYLSVREFFSSERTQTSSG